MSGIWKAYVRREENIGYLLFAFLSEIHNEAQILPLIPVPSKDSDVLKNVRMASGRCGYAEALS